MPENPYLPAPHADPPRPYHQPVGHLRLPTALPQAVSTAFAEAADNQREAGALLYGVRGTYVGDVDVVYALIIPAQIGHRTHYRIPPESIAAASAATRAHGWVTLGQVHSHPGDDVEHSWYDDRHAISTRAVSFVLPNYGRDASDWLARIGVHDYQDGWWHQLTAEQAATRVSFTSTQPHILDLRTEAARTT
jgi:Prokaryotic homologs of the JAB domain